MRSTPLNPRRQALATLPMTAAVSAALSATALLLPSTASAQLEEVVVTARARAESLQDVPSTVTAFTANQISDMGIQRAEDFISQTPGVSFVNTVETGDPPAKALYMEFRNTYWTWNVAYMNSLKNFGPIPCAPATSLPRKKSRYFATRKLQENLGSYKYAPLPKITLKLTISP